MSKRFIDTNLFDDPWFMELSKDGKLLWIYMITKCDHAGIIELNNRLIVFITGIKDIETVTKELGNRIVRVSKDLYFVPKFISFQYPDFPQSKVKQQLSAVKILTKYGLFNNGKLTLSKELMNYYVNDNDNGNDIGNEEGGAGGNIFLELKELEKEMLNSFTWIEDISRNTKTPIETIKLKIREYVKVIQNRGEEGKELKDAKFHFSNWLSKNNTLKPVIQDRGLCA